MQAESSIFTILLLILLQQTVSIEDGYLEYVKDACYIKGEALSCMKYRALKIAKNTFFGDMHSNETIKASKMISFVHLDNETIMEAAKYEEEALAKEPRSFMSEWSEFTKYLMKLVKEFFKNKGLKVNLPEGARTIEEPEDDDARGKKKKLAVMVPLLNLVATLKTKLLLIPILLAVLLIKKLLLVAALLVPSLLSTLKSCKQHHHPMTHYSSYFDGGSSDFNTDYGSSYAYSAGGGYGKEYASNKAYLLPKHRPTPAPVYITAPGATV